MHDDARRAYQKTTSLFYRFAERLSLATGHVYESWRGGSTDMVSLPIPISIYRCMLRVLPSSPVDEALKQDYSEVQKLSHAKFEVCDWRADACDMWCLMRRRVSPATFKVGGDIQSLGLEICRVRHPRSGATLHVDPKQHPALCPGSTDRS
jgi:hypothetical protein